MKLDAQIPEGPIQEKWTKHKFNMKLVNPNNKRKFEILVIGSGLAGAAAAASMSELGYKVKVIFYQDSARRAHSIAAQGGINSSKNYPNDGDSVYRLFYDTVKGGDYRAREANVYRLAEVSGAIIDHAVAQGVPFAREYSGYLDNRSFGGAQLKRTFYAKGQTGQQLLLGAYSQLMKEAASGNVELLGRREVLDIVLVDGAARGVIVKNLETGEIERHAGHDVVLATGGYGNVYYLSTNAKGSNVSGAWAAYKRGAAFANPAYVQIHPTCIPVHGDYQSKLTLMSESLRNDGRVWAPKAKGDARKGADIPEEERDYYLERRYPSFGNLVPRDVASRAAKVQCDLGHGAAGDLAVFLDFSASIKRDGKAAIEARYGNLFDMYQKITDENPYERPMRIYPAIHYVMGGLWVDYNLMSNIPGLHVLGEANFSDHGANRLGASALMQGLADGYFVIPYTIGHYLAQAKLDPVTTEHEAFKEAEENVTNKLDKLINLNGNKTVDEFHRDLGLYAWDKVGMARNKQGLEEFIKKVPEMREDFWKNAKLVGSKEGMNAELIKASRVADFFEMAELLARDALQREESCGGHFREEHQTEEGEAKRDDENFAFVGAWEYKGEGKTPELHKEQLTFEYAKPSQRSYK